MSVDSEGDPAILDGFIASYKDEILRWNASINLISRRDSGLICDGLIAQCCGAFSLFWSWVRDRGLYSGRGSLSYWDLGSGAGFPGVIWNQLFFREGVEPATVLVEPRVKRAWFLGRVGSLAGASPFAVETGRWGENSMMRPILQPGGLAAVSLKALHLNDFDVLTGLVHRMTGNMSFSGGFPEVVIARFYPPGQRVDAQLKTSLGLSHQGPRVECSGGALVFQECDILGPTEGSLPASLVVSRYTMEQF